jgi:hypothetical protein
MEDIRTSDIGLKRLAESHVETAVRRLGELVNESDPRIALEASQLVLRLARPHSPGVWPQWPSWPSPWDLEGGWGGWGGRAG